MPSGSLQIPDTSDLFLQLHYVTTVFEIITEYITTVGLFDITIYYITSVFDNTERKKEKLERKKNRKKTERKKEKKERKRGE